jgi:hypothetical protein
VISDSDEELGSDQVMLDEPSLKVSLPIPGQEEILKDVLKEVARIEANKSHFLEFVKQTSQVPESFGPKNPYFEAAFT